MCKICDNMDITNDEMDESLLLSIDFEMKSFTLVSNLFRFLVFRSFSFSCPRFWKEKGIFSFGWKFQLLSWMSVIEMIYFIFNWRFSLQVWTWKFLGKKYFTSLIAYLTQIHTNQTSRHGFEYKTCLKEKKLTRFKYIYLQINYTMNKGKVNFRDINKYRYLIN